jgi:succinate-semialdehyde dehydrogenase / glutarate-semialdehyde dehydrogenase
MRKAGAALAAGCTIVVKPAETTPLGALYLAKLGEWAGLPPGTLSVLPSSDAPAIGTVLAEDPRIRLLSFTGSTPAGQKLMQQASSNVKRLSLELGGNAPFVVFEDADLEAAVEGCVTSKFMVSGQCCIAANRYDNRIEFYKKWNGEETKKDFEGNTVNKKKNKSLDI